MDPSLFLAKFLGLYMIIIGFAWIVRKNFFKKAVSAFFENPACIIFGGALALMFGIIILLINPIFTFHWKGLITLLGLLAFAKGILRLFFIEKESRYAQKCCTGKAPFYIGTVFILIGLYLTYHGFMA